MRLHLLCIGAANRLMSIALVSDPVLGATRARLMLTSDLPDAADAADAVDNERSANEPTPKELVRPPSALPFHLRRPFSSATQALLILTSHVCIVSPLQLFISSHHVVL